MDNVRALRKPPEALAEARFVSLFAELVTSFETVRTEVESLSRDDLMSLTIRAGSPNTGHFNIDAWRGFLALHQILGAAVSDRFGGNGKGAA